MIVLDSTVLLYAVAGDHPLADPCRHIIEELGEGRARATTTVDAIRRFVDVRSRVTDRAEAAALGLDYATLLTPLAPESSGLAVALHAFPEMGPDISAADAVLAASAMTFNPHTLISTDRRFSQIPHLHHVDVTADDLDEVLARG